MTGATNSESVSEPRFPDPASADIHTQPRSRWSVEPSLREILLLVAMTGGLFVCTIVLFGHFLPMVAGTADNPSFLSIAAAIRHWNFQGLGIKAFWGLPYAMAAVSLITRISDRNALLLVSYCAGILAVVLVYRLWGGWVAGFFAVLNFDWMQRLFLCGSEPLFMALLLGSFLAVRKQRWLLAALLAALSVTVRPLGMFALVAVGLALLWKRDFRKFSLATAIGLLVGALYILPLKLYFQNPLANVNSYQQNDWQGGRLLSWPFDAILQTASAPGPLTNLLLTWGWIVFVLIGFVALLLTKNCRAYWKKRPVEMIFAVGYLLFLCTYNSPRWIRGSFPRFSIPILPLILWALLTWIPKDRRLLWGIALISPVLAAASAIGIKNVAAMIRQAI